MIPSDSVNPICAVVKQYWGYDSLRPLQFEAMEAARSGRDALVVLPTGGGKSLCYQAPALMRDQPTVVISPLIALMKDQVDALIERGISAAFLNSSLSVEDRQRVTDGIKNREYKLIFVAPERFASPAFWNLLESGGVGAFAIDEAHCISHWGHDFRSDYRRLDQLNVRFPHAVIHAFTATATPRVRQDIIEQLSLRSPTVLVGDFFRPNLRYSVLSRKNVFEQVLDLVKERQNQAGIVYCLRRRDVDELSNFLKISGVEAAGYHAGMSDVQRTRVQDRFTGLRTDVIVATVAFGMGIDRSDIRFVIHAAMPKSIEHYQQETGRAGRDGQPADCILLYSGSDILAWKRIMQSGDGVDMNTVMPLLNAMSRFCTGINCRHKSLVTYFGQEWSLENCGACDLCSDGVVVLDDSTVRAQKIMSGVVRTGQRFGASYVCDVLVGDLTESVTERGHASIKTFGIMCDDAKRSVMTWVDQLVDQDMLIRDGEFRILKVTDAGWRVLRSEAEARLLPAPSKRKSPRRKKRTDKKQSGVIRAKRKRRINPFTKSSARVRLHEALGRELNCVACGYSLIGNASGTCPECGMDVDLETLGVSLEDFQSVAGKRAGVVDEPATEPPEQEALNTREEVSNIQDETESGSEALFEKLRRVRYGIAKEINKPAFVVFSDRTLRAIAQAAPTTEEEMLAIKGVGPAKLDSYGQQFIDAIADEPHSI